jgi:hypothetical protein
MIGHFLHLALGRTLKPPPGVGGRSQHDVAFGDGARGRMDQVDLDLARRQLVQGIVMASRDP